jgi:hypothetical protein
MSNSQPQPTIRFIKSTSQGSAIFSQFYKDETLVDVTLSCIQSNHQINAHRLVLAACSPYFRNMFEKQSNPLYPIVNIDNIYVEDLRLVLEFMYKGEVMIPNERLANVVRCATSLEVDGFPTDLSGMV